MRVDITDIDQLRDLFEAVSGVSGSEHGARLREFLKGKLARYQRID